MSSTELQRKIFTRYVRQKLLKRDITVTDVCKDAQDGTLLLALLEVLADKKYEGKPFKKTKLRVQMIDNINNALRFIWDQGVEMKLKPSAENIVDGDERAILGLVWAIMSKFMKFGDDDEDGPALSAKDALLMWAQNKVASYNIELKTFKNFRDGKALCAIIHKHRPQLVDMEALGSDSNANLEAAQNAALKYFELEKYITPAEIQKLDENSMCVYVSEFYYGIAEQRKLDLASRRVGKVVKLTKENDALRAEYAEKAQQFVDHVKGVEGMLEDRTIDNTMAGARKRLDDFYAYKTGAKGEIIELQLDLEALFNNLAMRLALNNRPEFTPPEGKRLADIVKVVQHLEECEAERSVALVAELNRQLRLVELNKQHTARVEKLQAWHAAKKAYLETREDINSISEAQLQLRLLDAFDKEREAVSAGTFSDVQKLGAELGAEKYENQADVEARESGFSAGLEELAGLSASKRPYLDDALAREIFKENVRRLDSEHADLASVIAAWHGAKAEYLERVETIGSVEDANTQLALLEAFGKEKVRQSDGNVALLKELATKILESKYETEFSSWTWEKPDEVRGRVTTAEEQFANLDTLAAAKKERLEKALALEQEKEALRLEFAHSAAGFQLWVADQTDLAAFHQFGFTLEEVQAFKATLDADDAALEASGNDKIAALTATADKMSALGVTENRYTEASVESLTTARGALVEAVAARRSAYDAELARQIANDNLCKEFAAAADPFSAWMTETKGKVTESKEELEAQVAFIDERLGARDGEGAALKTITEIDGRMAEAGITNNRHTNLTLKDVEVQWKQYETFLERKKKMLEDEIERQKLRGVTPEQFAEIEANFKQFDANDDGFLDRREVKTCLYSLGEEKTSREIKELVEEHGADGKMPYEGYKTFMVGLLGVSDTKDDILESFKLITRYAPVATVERMELSGMAGDDIAYIKETAPAKDDGYDFVPWVDDVFSR